MVLLILGRLKTRFRPRHVVNLTVALLAMASSSAIFVLAARADDKQVEPAKASAQVSIVQAHAAWAVR